MLIDKLFRDVLVRPAAMEGADELLIVSGYATAGMVEQHIDELRRGVSENRIDKLPRIQLLVGMASHGIEIVQHRGLSDLAKKFDQMFSCSYLIEGPPCHSKVFVWKKKGVPMRAFVGSANYTIAGFGRSQREAIVKADPRVVSDYHEALMLQSIPCTSQDVETSVRLMHTRDPSEFADDNVVTLSLLATKGNRKGKTHQAAGLNWGQRYGRDPNQAYIPIPKEVRDRSFFPPIAERFTALTDDDKSLILVVAQQYGKALHSTLDNSELGRYLRRRIGVSSGEFVTRQHLERYGRLDVSFYRIDSETYQMDFGPNNVPIETLERLEQ